MECKHLTPRYGIASTEHTEHPEPVKKPKTTSLDSLQESMRISMMEGTNNLMNKFFDSLQTMEPDAVFVKTMLQLFKFSIPTFKSLEVKEKPVQQFDEEFFLKYNLKLD